MGIGNPNEKGDGTVAKRIEEASPAEGRGPVKAEAYGAAGILQALQGLDFPAGKTQILRKIKGRERIAWGGDRSIDIQAIIESLPDAGFESVSELLRMIVERVPEEAKA